MLFRHFAFQRNPNSDRSISPLLSNLIHGPMTMSSSSSLHFPQILDDRDLDDAELWAVIDSATASRSSRKTPLLALTNSSHSPAPKPSRRPRNEIEASPRVSADGEVVQFQEERWPCRRPQKAARLADPGGDRQMVVVRHPPRPPVVTPPSPASSYASPVPGRHVVKQVSPVVESPPPPPTFDSWNGEEKENQRHSLSGRFPSVSLFKQYQNAAMAILEKTDYTMISGSPFIKKSGWRKISFFFNLSYEIKDKSIEFDENRNVQRAEFVVRAFMQGGRFSDGWGSCDRREKRFLKPNHDVPSTAETRAKNKACQDLLGIGEYRPGVKL